MTPAFRADLLESPYANEDLVPTAAEERGWSRWNIAALWIGMAVCVPTYMIASGLIATGMSWWQALLTIAAGNLIVLVPMILNGHAGTKYGVPFPVLLRAPFGILGANVPALLRGLVACGWFGIQTWIGGHALYALARVIWPLRTFTSVRAHLKALSSRLPSISSKSCFSPRKRMPAGTAWLPSIARPFAILPKVRSKASSDGATSQTPPSAPDKAAARARSR